MSNGNKFSRAIVWALLAGLVMGLMLIAVLQVCVGGRG